MSALLSNSGSATAPAAQAAGGPDLWEDRFANEKYMWGPTQSPTATLLGDTLTQRMNTTALHSTLNIIDIGTGYMRDPKYLHNRCNARVTGLDKSRAGLALGEADLHDAIDAGWVHVVRGQFSKASLATNAFDAAMSHRVLHLLGNNGEVDAFVDTLTRIVKPYGLIAISARDDRDNKDMVVRADGQVEPTFRPGHLISRWNEARFRKTFEQNFKIMRFIQTEEIESIPLNPTDQPKMTPITIMLAEKRKSPKLIP